MHRLDDRGREWLGDVADAEADHLRVGVGSLVRAYAPADLREQVAGGEFCEALVDTGHECPERSPAITSEPTEAGARNRGAKHRRAGGEHAPKVRRSRATQSPPANV